MTPLERAARAILDAPMVGPSRPDQRLRTLLSGTFTDEMLLVMGVNLARAVLTAIREPSDSMMEIVVPRPDYWPPAGQDAVKDKILSTDRHDRAAHWQAMIDAALSEGG